MDVELSSEVGPAGRLFKSNVDLFWALLQRILILDFKDRQKKALRDEFGRLYFWGDGYYPFEGRLDGILANSSRLRYRVLSLLVEVGEILCDEKKGLFALIDQNFGDTKLKLQCIGLRSLIDAVRESLDQLSDSDSGSDPSEADDLFEDIIEDLRSRNQCLIDLSASLDRPAADADTAEKGAAVTLPFKTSGPAEIWTRKIIDTYAKIDVTLAERLGEANWHRYQRISKNLENMEALSDDSDEEEDDEIADLPEFSAMTKSSKDQSSIFSATGAQSSGLGTTATSISLSDFDYSFPIARKRAIAKDARSQATYTSVVSNDQGERGWLRIPVLPKTATTGKPFRCTVCGDKIKDFMDRTEWKRHVFADLEPYVCTFQECPGGITPFKSRKSWADHEFSIHRITKTWICNECAATFEDRELFRQHFKWRHANFFMGNQLEVVVNAAERQMPKSLEGASCPFCPENPGTKNRTFAMHVARHMEEIALAVLPRDFEIQDEHGSITSNDSFPAIIDEADAQGGLSSMVLTTTTTDDTASPKSKDPLMRVGLADFNFLAVLGKSTRGKTFLAETKVSKSLYAVKVLRKDFLCEVDEVDSLKNEKKVFLLGTKERHPFLVKLAATFQTETRIWYVLEYVSGGDLIYHIQRNKFGLRRTQFYAAELCHVLKFFHEHGIIYRNMTLDNTLIAPDGHIKVVGFWLSKEEMWYGKTTKTFCGVPELMAPELLLDKEYSVAVDWWALGIITYQMLLQQSPFRGEDEDAIYDSILSEEPIYPIHLQRDAVSFISGLLNRDPEKRLGGGPQGWSEVMQHHFFKGTNWEDLYHKRLAAPFIPEILHDRDTSNFDSEFTSATPNLTPVQSVLSLNAQEQFRGFSQVVKEEDQGFFRP